MHPARARSGGIRVGDADRDLRLASKFDQGLAERPCMDIEVDRWSSLRRRGDAEQQTGRNDSINPPATHIYWISQPS
jgi:hypothetical protein